MNELAFYIGCFVLGVAAIAVIVVAVMIHAVKRDMRDGTWHE